MASPVAQKLKIREGASILVIHPPEKYAESLGVLPKDVKFGPTISNPVQVHWFVQNRTQMEKELKKVMSMVKENVVCWIFYPKGSSGMQTDLTRDKGWDALLALDLHWLNLVSFNETWSAFAMRKKTAADEKRSAKKEKRPVFDYVDPVAKTVIIPDDLAKAFKKNAKEAAYFHSLAFSHKKEYIEWIVTARKEATRAQRVAGTIERLAKSWKNPANR